MTSVCYCSCAAVMNIWVSFFPSHEFSWVISVALATALGGMAGASYALEMELRASREEFRRAKEMGLLP